VTSGPERPDVSPIAETAQAFGQEDDITVMTITRSRYSDCRGDFRGSRNQLTVIQLQQWRLYPAWRINRRDSRTTR
jgi:hypothetical protein